MSKDVHFITGFYCRGCGSTTAVLVGNLNIVRCMGCLQLYERGEDWQPVEMKGMAMKEDLPPPCRPEREL